MSERRGRLVWGRAVHDLYSQPQGHSEDPRHDHEVALAVLSRFVANTWEGILRLSIEWSKKVQQMSKSRADHVIFLAKLDI